MRDLKRFVRYFRPYKSSLILGCLGVVASVSMGLFIPLVLGNAIDTLQAGVTWNKLGRYALIVLGLSLGSGLLAFLQRYVLSRMACDIDYDLRRDFYAHLQQQPLSFFHQNRTGNLMARATSDVLIVRQLTGPLIMYVLQPAVTLLIALTLMLRISITMTLLLFLTLPLFILTAIYFGRRIHLRAAHVQDFFAQIVTRAHENITGIRVIRAYAQEDAEVKAFNELSSQYVEQKYDLVRLAALMRPLMQFLVGSDYLVVIWYGSMLVLRGEITIGEFTEYSLYLTRLVWSLFAVGNIIDLYQRGTASLKRIDAIFATEPDIIDKPGVQTRPEISGRIEFRHLTFSYNEHSEKVLHNINCIIEAGQTVAFVGRPGSGKSTLLNLVPRLYESPSDTILIDGVPIQDYPLAQLRTSIGYVPQETFLFGDSLAENIAFGVVQVDQAGIERAAEIAGLSEDIRSFPDGLETWVGERGVTLSGGQKQRTAIARAILREPKILILDDAFSSVDTGTENMILARLRDVMRSRTSLIVSHRISTVRDADMIYVLDEGSIVECGTHDELLKRDGEYARLCQRQFFEESLNGSAVMKQAPPTHE